MQEELTSNLKVKCQQLVSAVEEPVFCKKNWHHFQERGYHSEVCKALHITENPAMCTV